MCVAVSGKVIEIAKDEAIVDIQGRKRSVSVLLLPDVRVGNLVLISNGMIVERLSEEEAAERGALLAAMLEAIDETA
jgi:hydrogenase expression/formation protein HypC